MLHQENLVFVCPNTRGGVHCYIEWFLNNKKREHIHSACLHAVEMFKNVESVNTQNDYVEWEIEREMNRQKENSLVLCVL